MGINREEGGLTFAWLERKTPVLRSALQLNQSSLCDIHRSSNQGENCSIVSIKRAAGGRRQRSRKISDGKRENIGTKNGSLQNTSTDFKGTTIAILKNHASALIRKEKLNSTSKTERQASQNKFVEKGGVPDRVESFREVDSSKTRATARPRFVKPIKNELRKEQNLIKSI